MPTTSSTPSGACSRRRFLIRTAGAAGALTLAPMWLSELLRTAAADSPVLEQLVRAAPPARYWVSTQTPDVDCRRCHAGDGVDTSAPFDHGQILVKCELCAQECRIPEGARGRCRTRINVDGQLKSLVYGRPVSVHVDPIEKKPLFHYRPGTQAFSLATAGCPLSCKFCQNWEISQARPEDLAVRFAPPELVVQSTAQRQVPTIAFTYNEPTVFAEYLIDIARAARRKGIRSVLISCGFMNPQPLDDMCDVLDAIKIDLKGFDTGFYRNVCGAELAPVLRSIRETARRGVHLEIVNLVVPTLNDSDRMLAALIDWVLGEVGPDVPVHFTRFHPDYQMRNLPPTPVATLEHAYAMARDRGLRYPYVGNVPGHQGNHTFCPGCGNVVIRRTGFFTTTMDVVDGRCRFCRTPIAGVFSA